MSYHIRTVITSVHIYYDVSNTIVLELMGKGNTKSSPGLWTNCTCGCKHLRHRGSKIRHLGSNVHVCHDRGEQEGNLARYLNIEIMQITCNKLQFGSRLLGYCVSAKLL